MNENKFDSYFVSHLYFGYDGKPLEGGAEIHLREIINIVKERGLNAKVIQCWYRNEVIYRNDYLEVEGVNISLIAHVYAINFVWRKKVPKRARIIHLNDIAFSFPFVDGHVTITFHGVGWDIPINIPFKYALPKYFSIKALLSRLYLRNQMKYAVKRSKKILSVDSSLLRIVQHEFPEYREKVTVIPNFVDTNVFRPTPQRKSEFGLSDDDFVILYPRNISVQRGFPILLELIKYFAKTNKQMKFLVAGRSIMEMGHNIYFNILKRKLNEVRNAHEQVIFLGSIPHDQMWKVYNASDVVIIPSLFSEGTSLSALEAMACGKPVIASNVGGLNDIIINGYNGLLVPPDVSKFARAIMLLYLNKEMRNAILTRGLKIAREVYNKDRWKKQIIEFFDL